MKKLRSHLSQTIAPWRQFEKSDIDYFTIDSSPHRDRLRQSLEQVRRTYSLLDAELMSLDMLISWNIEFCVQIEQLIGLGPKLIQERRIREGKTNQDVHYYLVSLSLRIAIT